MARWSHMTTSGSHTLALKVGSSETFSRRLKRAKSKSSSSKDGGPEFKKAIWQNNHPQRTRNAPESTDPSLSIEPPLCSWRVRCILGECLVCPFLLATEKQASTGWSHTAPGVYLNWYLTSLYSVNKSVNIVSNVGSHCVVNFVLRPAQQKYILPEYYLRKSGRISQCVSSRPFVKKVNFLLRGKNGEI